MKKILTMLLTLVALFAFTIPVFANEIIDTQTGNVGVSPFRPLDDDVTVYGTSQPSSVWDCSVDGRYNFSGRAYNEDLYTNYAFSGKSTYNVYVKNTEPWGRRLKYGVYIQQLGFDNPVYVNSIQNYENKTIYVESSDRIYVRFFAPSSFNGYIE